MTTGSAARVVYVDHDPVVCSHAEAMTAGDDTTAVVLADLRDTAEVNPGLVLVSRWRPEDGEPGPDAERAWAYGGVAAI
jgi:hypothetical protein